MTTPTHETNDSGFVRAEDVEQTVLRVVAKAFDHQLPKVAAEVAQNEIAAADKVREYKEDHRADRRNRNRSLTLVVALAFTFLVPWFIADVLVVPTLLKFATGISIIPDAAITLWAYVKKI